MEKLGVPDTASPLQVAGPVAVDSVAKTAGGQGAFRSSFFWCACPRRQLLQAYREELCAVLRLTGPLLASRVLNFLLPFVNTIFCGHIGNAELAGYALASATINVTTSSTGFGLALACDTLISQTFGGQNLKRVGVILQRSTLILLLFCLPCWAVLLNCQNLLLLMQQEEEVARIAQLYVMAFLPAVPAMFVHGLQVSYLQNQGIILPQMYTAAVANILNLGANYILIFSLQMGVIGSAIANSFSQVIACLLLYGYIRWQKLHEKTWGGWSSECLQEWGGYMQLAIPSTCMICFEWWIWEIGGFLAGILGEVDLAAQHVLLEFGAITYMIPLGIHAAACVRVGNALGAGDTASALMTCKVTLALAGVLAVVQGITVAASKSVIGYIFTHDENIVAIVSSNLSIYTIIQIFDALLCTCSGILVGTGMQKIAAWSNLLSYYCIGLPVGIALMFSAKLRILGFSLGLFTSVVVQTVFIVILIYKVNWHKVAQKAQVRAGKKVLVTSTRPLSQLVTEAVVPDITNIPDPIVERNEPTKQGVYNLVPTQEHELKDKAEANASSKGGLRVEEDTGRIQPTAVVLSSTQLALRRGLTVLATGLTLAVGIVVHIVLPPPEPSAQTGTNFTMDWVNNSAPTNFTPLTASF